MRYFMTLSYKGTNYCGWQRQESVVTVQGEVERALGVLLRVPTEVTGCGRTDTGVHARNYVCHFDCQQDIDTKEIAYRLNAILPQDIAIHSVVQVEDGVHARFDATQRTYNYHLRLSKNPFGREAEWQLYADIDVEKMNKAAEKLLVYDDFTTFAKLHGGNKTNICHIYKAQWSEVEEGLLVFEISADRFLRNMVRAIVAALVEVGRGKLTVEQFEEIIKAKDLSRARGSAPSQGLFLTDIKYK